MSLSSLSSSLYRLHCRKRTVFLHVVGVTIALDCDWWSENGDDGDASDGVLIVDASVYKRTDKWQREQDVACWLCKFLATQKARNDRVASRCSEQLGANHTRVYERRTEGKEKVI